MRGRTISELLETTKGKARRRFINGLCGSTLSSVCCLTTGINRSFQNIVCKGRQRIEGQGGTEATVDLRRPVPFPNPNLLNVLLQLLHEVLTRSMSGKGQ